MHRRLLPILEPCGEDFESMEREGPRLRCERCRTVVHDLSAMTRAEARLLLLGKRGTQICIRYAAGPDGELRFVPPPARTAGALVTALAGLMAACTGTGERLEVPPPDGITWHDDGSLTIPSEHSGDGTECDRGWWQGIVVPSEYASGSTHYVGGGITVGLLVAEDAPAPAPPPPVERIIVDARERTQTSPRKAQRLARKQRRAERTERRRLLQRAQDAQKEQRRELRQAEREVVKEHRRAERKRRRLARKAERKRRRLARKAERKRRAQLREAERAVARKR